MFFSISSTPTEIYHPNCIIVSNPALGSFSQMFVSHPVRIFKFLYLANNLEGVTQGKYVLHLPRWNICKYQNDNRQLMIPISARLRSIGSSELAKPLPFAL
ncbi:hypothetical protein Plhal304r1_c023g0079311 [Plasmopara halstedii]